MAAYAKATFGLYQGNKEKVHIQFPNSMCGVFIDRFGKDITFRPVMQSTANVRWMSMSVRSSSGGYSVLEKNVKVTRPVSVVEQMRKAAEEFVENY